MLSILLFSVDWLSATISRHMVRGQEVEGRILPHWPSLNRSAFRSKQKNGKRGTHSPILLDKRIANPAPCAGTCKTHIPV